ncbi:MAG: hypothetical protein ACJAVK_000770 [Akkermansiaceae bacterium]|jgi:hypothetical protein
MSEDTPQTPENEGALDLSSLNFGPAWARDPSESKSLKKYKDRGDRDDKRGGGGRRDDHRGGGGPRRDQRGGGGGGGGGGGFRGNQGGGGSRGRREDDRRPPRQEVEPPEGVNLRLMPAEESLDLLAKRVIDSGQTFSVFDLAKVLLQSRDRFRVTFDSPEKKFYRCREDQSLWLTRDEALRHLWRGDWTGKYYEEVKVEGEAPKGSFSSVARCGLSNELLGPPNYHGYQEKLIALHRERFSNMSLDAYKAKVRMERGEEAVEAWLESMKTVTKWKVAEPKSEEPEAKEEVSGEKPAEEAPAEASAGKVAEPAADEVAIKAGAPADESEGVTVEAPVTEPEATPEAEESAPNEEETPAEETPVELFDDTRAVERHFAEKNFEVAFEETNRAWVIGDIRGNLLSPGLLTLLKRGVAEEKRYPAKLMPLVCRQLSGRHVAVFKWNKKLKVGPSRPHAVPDSTPLSERPRTIIDHLSKHSGVALKEFWEAVMPKGVTAEQKHDWLQDFQWLLSQGHIILLADTTIHIAKKGDGDNPPQKRAAKKSRSALKERTPVAKSEPAKVPVVAEPKTTVTPEVPESPVVESSPEPEPEVPESPVVESSPETEPEVPESPVVESSPKPEPEVPESPVVESSPEPEPEVPESPVVESSPKPEPEVPESPVVESSPKPEPEVPESPVVESSPEPEAKIDDGPQTA